MQPVEAFLLQSCRILLPLAALALASCVGSAHTCDVSPPPQPEAQTIYIYLNGAEPTEDMPAEVASDNPFDSTRAWSGEYDCPQGTTALTIRVVSVNDKRVKAIFDFEHKESGAAGSYYIAGQYDEATRSIKFRPRAWIEHPPNYMSTGMIGRVSADGKQFTGRIDHPACGAFKLRAAR